MTLSPRTFTLGALFFILLAGCAGTGGGEQTLVASDTLSRAEHLQALLNVLAADSLEGRLTGSRGSALAADFTESLTYATIHRFNRQRSITLEASVSPGISPETIVGKLTSPVTEKTGWFGLGSPRIIGPSPLDQVRANYPGVTIEMAGRQQQMADAFSSLPLGFLAAAVMIYVILAWLFSSYFQPLVVMLVIPFSLVGVIWGHLLLGYDLTFLSLIGFVALSGIVVNDSLILVEFYNKMRAKGLPLRDALVAAGRARLRAILLTTITTVLGLTPLILERSFQAKFLIPMAISIAMGLISATVLILVVLPCVMVIFDDIAGVLYHLWYGRPRQTEPPATGTLHDDSSFNQA